MPKAACRHPQSFLRKSNGDGLSRVPGSPRRRIPLADEDNVICRDRVNRSDSIRYFVALLYDHVSEPQYLPPSEHRLIPEPKRTYAKSTFNFNGDISEHTSRDVESGRFGARRLDLVLECPANDVRYVKMREHWHV